MRPHHKQYIRLLGVIQADRGGAALRPQSSTGVEQRRRAARETFARAARRANAALSSELDVAEAGEQGEHKQQAVAGDGDGWQQLRQWRCLAREKRRLRDKALTGSERR